MASLPPSNADIWSGMRMFASLNDATGSSLNDDVTTVELCKWLQVARWMTEQYRELGTKSQPH